MELLLEDVPDNIKIAPYCPSCCPALSISLSPVLAWYWLTFLLCEHCSSLYSRLRRPSTILIMPFLSQDPIAIEAPIMSDCRCARLEVRSKPVRLNMRSGSDDIGAIVIKLSAMRASRGYWAPFTWACQYAITSIHVMSLGWPPRVSQSLYSSRSL